MTITGSNFANPIDTYTKLLLHADGTNNSTTFVDSETTPKTVSAIGSAKISTAQSKFGGSSALFANSTSTYLSVPDNDDFYFNGDFTIDLYVRWTGSPSGIGVESIMGQSEGGGAKPKWGLYYNNPNNGQLTFEYWTPSLVQTQLTWNWSASGDTWYHVAIVRSGNSWYAFINGTSLGTLTQANALPNVITILKIGCDGEGWNAFSGYLDEVRISKGIARWTSNFTPPTLAYGNALITFGGSSATNVLVTSSTTITATTPAHAAGAVDVVITKGDGNQQSVTGAYTYTP